MTTSLAEVLTPLGREDLRADALVLRGDRGRFAGLMSIARLGEILAGLDEHAPLDRIHGGIAGACVRPTLGKLEADGSSLRVRRIHRMDERLMAFALGLHADLGEEVNINAYWSPPRSELGLAPHDDGYDILVLQVHGRKSWTLAGEPERPLTDDGVVARGRLGEFILGAGDVLYLPARLRHVAANPHDEASLHLTVGIYGKTDRSVLEWLASELGRGPFGALPFGDERVLAEALRRVRDAAVELLDAPDAVERFRVYREATEYERILASAEEHEKSSVRGYR